MSGRAGPRPDRLPVRPAAARARTTAGVPPARTTTGTGPAGTTEERP
jgi:hypothetical protein